MSPVQFELHVAPETDPEAVVAIENDDESGRVAANTAAQTLSMELGESFTVRRIAVDADEKGGK